MSLCCWNIPVHSRTSKHQSAVWKHAVLRELWKSFKVMWFTQLRPRTHRNVSLRFSVYCLLFSRESRTTSSLLETIQKRRKTFPCVQGLIHFDSRTTHKLQKKILILTLIPLVEVKCYKQSFIISSIECRDFEIVLRWTVLTSCRRGL